MQKYKHNTLHCKEEKFQLFRVIKLEGIIKDEFYAKIKTFKGEKNLVVPKRY